MYVWLVPPSDRIARAQVNVVWDYYGIHKVDSEKTLWTPFEIEGIRSHKDRITIAPDNTRVVQIEGDSVEALCQHGYMFHSYLEAWGISPSHVIQKTRWNGPWARSWILQDLVRFPSTDFLHLWGSNAPFIEGDKMCMSWRSTLSLKDGDCYIGRIAAPIITVPGGRYLIGEYGCMFEDGRGHISYFNAFPATSDKVRALLLKKSRFPKNRLGSRL